MSTIGSVMVDYIYKYIFIHILYFMFVVTVYTFDSS